MASTRKKLAKASLLLIGLEFLTAGTGLVKQMLIAAQFGTSATTDAYVVAMTVVGLILLWLTLPISQVIIPMFRYDLTQQGEGRAWANISVLFNNLLLVVILVVAAAWLFAPGLVDLTSPGFTEGASDLATALTRTMVLSIIFIAAGQVLAQVLFSYERFFLPGITDLVNNLVVVVAFLALRGTYGIYGLAIAVVLGGAFEFASQLPILWEKRKLYRAQIDPRHPGMREMGRLGFPLVIANSSVELARITDRIFASLLPAGRLSALAFGHRLTNVFLELLVAPLHKATFPHFTKLSAEENFQALSSQYSRYLRTIFFLTLPAAVGMVVAAEPVVRLLYQRGAFDETSVRLTSQAVACYAIGFPAVALSRAFNRMFISLKDTWTPMKTTLLRIGVKILLAWILIYPFSHVGLALAESLSNIVRAVVMFFLLPDRVKGQESWNTLFSFGRTLLGAALMGAVVYWAAESMDGLFNLPVELVTLVVLGVASYALIAFLFRWEESQFVLRALFERKTKRLSTDS